MGFHLPILGFLGRSVLELGRSTRQTDGQTNRHRVSIYNAQPYNTVVGGKIKHAVLVRGPVCKAYCIMLSTGILEVLFTVQRFH